MLRILRVKKQIGLLVHSGSIYPKEEDLINIGTMESDKIALDAARESIIMVKNDNILPLSRTEKILVSGPSASLLKVKNNFRELKFLIRYFNFKGLKWRLELQMVIKIIYQK